MHRRRITCRGPQIIEWYSGVIRPHRPRELNAKTPLPSSGLLFIGEKGKMITAYSGGQVLLLPENKFRDFEPPPKTPARTIGHYKEWVQACKGASPPVAISIPAAA